jgi:hypothetical protein
VENRSIEYHFCFSQSGRYELAGGIYRDYGAGYCGLGGGKGVVEQLHRNGVKMAFGCFHTDPSHVCDYFGTTRLYMGWEGKREI